MDEPIPEEPVANAPRAQKDAYTKHTNDLVDVGCLMLATMVSELQRHLEHMEAYEMIVHLKEIFQQQVRQERYETIKALHSCKMAEGASFSTHVLKMKSYIDHLERLGFPLNQEFATDLILNSLLKSYDQVVSWKSLKQSIIADSAIKAEYLAASDVAKEAVWIRKFIVELGVVLNISDPMNLFYDNSGAIT
ncbi:uncharacterized protein LOC129289995 [Prosopis cineraria]|uniref:uncharacterized protein LOC129289995 n=1 Tax=Prosopis cineraria TaxID=364024 RepID=UPI00240F3B73|nr:uncharacterized protein LOC129289995 [Prosopis cineraria]